VCAGVRLILDATLIKLASASDTNPARQQLTSLLDGLASLKKLLPPDSPCGAYLAQHLGSMHSRMLHKWLKSGLLQPLQGAPTPLQNAKQVRGSA
jgi:hypothetical protein